jgi:amino acid permease
VFTSSVILAIILFLSWLFRSNIQTVLDFTGGIFGILILFLMPGIELYRAREVLGEKRNIVVTCLPLAIAVLGIAFMGFNLFRIIRNLTGETDG